MFLCNFVKNQWILMQLSLLELQMNDTCDIINFTHLTWLVLLHHLMKVKTPKMLYYSRILLKNIASDDHSFIEVHQGHHVP